MYCRIFSLSMESLASMVGIYDRRAWLTGLPAAESSSIQHKSSHL
jgi:hypothetical protein